MIFSQYTNDQLNNAIIELTQKERKMTHAILLHINEIESRRLYAQMGFGSILEYLVAKCHYSESAAYRRIQAARLLKTVPEISDKIKSGEVNLSQLAKVQTAIRQHDKQSEQKISHTTKQDLINKISSLSAQQTEVVIAKEFNLEVQQKEIIKNQQDESQYISFKLSKEQIEKLNHIKMLMSHISTNPSLSEVVEYLSDFYLHKKKFKKDSLSSQSFKSNLDKGEDNKGAKNKDNKGKDNKNEDNKCEKNKGRDNKNNKSEDNKNNVNSKYSNEHKSSLSLIKHKNHQLKDTVRVDARSIKPSKLQSSSALQNRSDKNNLTPKIKLELKKKSGFCCEYVDSKTNKKCNSQFQLEIDHVWPKAKGGTDDIQNLRVLCREHNQLLMRQWF